jgi:hypothetical protein
MCWPIDVKKKKTKLYCIACFICDYNASFDDICASKCTKLSCNYFLKLITNTNENIVVLIFFGYLHL